MVAHTCNPSYSGGRGRRITWTLEVEVAVSHDHAIVLQPGQQKWNSDPKQANKQTKPEMSWIWWLTDIIPTLWRYFPFLFSGGFMVFFSHLDQYSTGNLFLLVMSSVEIKIYLIAVVSFFLRWSFALCYPGWSAMVRSQLMANSPSWVQAVLLPQPPK